MSLENTLDVQDSVIQGMNQYACLLRRRAATVVDQQRLQRNGELHETRVIPGPWLGLRDTSRRGTPEHSE